MNAQRPPETAYITAAEGAALVEEYPSSIAVGYLDVSEYFRIVMTKTGKFGVRILDSGPQAYKVLRKAPYIFPPYGDECSRRKVSSDTLILAFDNGLLASLDKSGKVKVFLRRNPIKRK